jgi:hypothetical protein
VVSSEKSDSVWILDFEAEEILKSFDGVVASINKVSDEDVTGFIDLST